MKSLIRSLIPALCMASGVAWSAGDPGGSTPGGAWSTATADPVLERFGEASSRKDWARAAEVARDGLASNASNADYHNLYAYAIRNGASPKMDLVFKHYNEALRLDPKHRGANEYLGEAYLMVGNLTKAKEQLGVLDKLCFFPCKEYSDLKKAVAEYEAKGK